MNLLRLLLIAFAVWLIFFFLRRLLSPRRKETIKESASADMVRCAHCGLHLPKTEALQRDAIYFCSQQHLDRHTPP